MKQKILFFALENAAKFDGKANPKAVLGKLLSAEPDAKKDMKSTLKLIEEVVADVNKLSPDEQESLLRTMEPGFSVKKEKPERKLFSFLRIPEGAKIKTAFPPGIEKYPHIGHAKACFINYLLAKEYEGEFVLRFEDTNPDLVKAEYYDMMAKDLAWLGITWDTLRYASDFMPRYYEYAEKLIIAGKAYMCSCKGETISENRKKGLPCKCREKSPDENLSLWKGFPQMAEGDAILRLKIDMEHKNSTMRDPSVFRLNRTPHARHGTKYAVWPTYDFQTSIADGIDAITHRLRSKEFEMRKELQKWIQSECELPITYIDEFARFNMEGVLSSGRIIREGIEKGELIGWDDPTLTTIAALRRRGFQPEAIKNFVVGTGISKSEATLTWDDLIMQNKRLLDKEAERYFFVRDPVKVKIIDAPVMEVDLRKHPEHPKGFRKFRLGAEFYVAKDDLEGLKEGDMIRFMDGINFVKEKKGLVFHSTDHKIYKEKGSRIIHWLPVGEKNLESSIMMPDKTIVSGLAEKDVAQLSEGQVIQFERFGFCRLDDKKSMRFWFTH